MKRPELILITIWFSTLLLNAIDFEGKAVLFAISTIVLSMYYIVGISSIFQDGMIPSKPIRLITGIALASSLITIPFAIFLRNWVWLEVFPFLNILWTSILIFILIKSKNGVYRSILFRTIPVLVLTAFFAFRPIGSSIYRNTIIFLNAGNDDLISNMLSIKLVEEAESELAKENCDKAIEYSLQSYKEGLNWLWIDEGPLDKDEISQIWKIQSTYTSVHQAYECKADKLYDQKNYAEALHYQLKADSFLNINPTALYDYWKFRRANSKNKIGLCYDRPYERDSAVSYFMKAIAYHVDSIGTPDTNLSTYFNNLSKSLSDLEYYKESNQVAISSIGVLDNDSLSSDKEDNYARAYIQLIYNSLAQNKLSGAQEYMDLAAPYIGSGTNCRYKLYQAVYLQKLNRHIEAIPIAIEAKECFIDAHGPNYQNVAESHSIIFDSQIALGLYDSAYQHIIDGKEITRVNRGIDSYRFYDYVRKEGFYNYITGKYSKSFDQLKEVKMVYENQLGQDHKRLPEVLSTIALLKIDLDDFNGIEDLIDECLRISHLHDFFIDNRSSNLLNEIASVYNDLGMKYRADTLYRKAIELENKSNYQDRMSLANSNNGLGIIQLEKADYRKADSLFNKSVELINTEFPNGHPNLGVILMNKAESELRKGQHELSIDLIEEAVSIYEKYHSSTHPTIGKMLLLKGEILVASDMKIKAQSEYKRAHRILKTSYSDEHPLVRNCESIIALLTKT